MKRPVGGEGPPHRRPKIRVVRLPIPSGTTEAKGLRDIKKAKGLQDTEAEGLQDTEAKGPQDTEAKGPQDTGAKGPQDSQATGLSLNQATGLCNAVSVQGNVELIGVSGGFKAHLLKGCGSQAEPSCEARAGGKAGRLVVRR